MIFYLFNCPSSSILVVDTLVNTDFLNLTSIKLSEVQETLLFSATTEQGMWLPLRPLTRKCQYTIKYHQSLH